MTRPRLLDLFAGAGGCAVGYDRAGFDVTGVDKAPHPDYPFPLVVGDALTVLAAPAFLEPFAVIHASPPCPRYSTATSTKNRHKHSDLIGPVRTALQSWGGTYVIENVPGAPLIAPATLCGSSFGLRVRRHRLFESNAALMAVPCHHHGHEYVGVYGDHWDRPGGWLRPNGTSRGVKATSLADAQDALGIDWMTDWDDLTDAIPPAYCEFVGAQLRDSLVRAA